MENNGTLRPSSDQGRAVGRKNWLFVGSAEGGKTAVIISSFLASWKQHNIHPRVYLADVLTRLTQGTKDLDALLPNNWRPCT
jgi:transposase